MLLKRQAKGSNRRNWTMLKIRPYFHGKELFTMQNLEHKIMMSCALDRLYQLSQTLPTDVHNPDDLKEVFSACGWEVMKALDNDRIHFDSDNDKAMLYGLLTVAVDYVMDGRLKTAFTQATIN